MTGTLMTAAIVAGGAVLAAVLSNLGNYWLERNKRGVHARRARS